MATRPDRWSAVERVYHAALARPIKVRAAFLAETCAGNDELRREVESLLAQGVSAEGFLDRGAVAAAAPMVSETAVATLTSRRIGVYQVLAPLGAGGMGEVYRARDTKLGRDVAIKILPAAFTAEPTRLARFEREARTLAALNHPNIGAIYGLEYVDGIPALVLELVEGPTLAERLTKGPLPMAEALTIAREIAEGLEAAHEKGIIHRDLKPANIKVTPDGSVKVLDFGLAKIVTIDGPCEDLSQSPTVTVGGTQENTVLGTAAYMSPEQARGRPVDKRTDIWAFGCVLCELLTGRETFSGETIADILASILEREPDWSALPESTPPSIRRLLQRCLDKEPKRRLRDIGDARMEIEHAQQPAVAPLQPVRDAAVAVAVLPFVDMSPANDQEYLCEGMAEEIMNALVHIDGIRVASRTSAFRARQHGADLSAIARVLSIGYVLEGSVRTSGSRLRVTARLTNVANGYQLWSERFDRDMQDIFAVQDEIAAGVVEAVKVRLAVPHAVVPSRAQVKNLEAYGHFLRARHLRYTRSDHGGALRCFKQAIAIDPTHSPSWVGMAEVTTLSAGLYSLAPAREAYAEAKQALATAEHQQGESAEARYVAGMIAFGERDWPASERALLRALKIEPGNVRALCWQARFLVLMGRLDEARSVLECARAIDPLAPYPYATTGFCLLGEGCAAESLPFLEQALAFDGENSLALWTKGAALVALGRAEEGVALLERANTPAHRGGHIHATLGWALASAGRLDDARGVLNFLRARSLPAPPVIAEGWLHASLGDRDAAFEVFDRAAAESQAVMAFPRFPGFDPVRADPRFVAFLARLRLPQGADPTRDRL